MVCYPRKAADQRPIPPADRSRILREAADALERRAHHVIEAYVAETGFTLADARTELR